jgi:hypothetical protein
MAVVGNGSSIMGLSTNCLWPNWTFVRADHTTVDVEIRSIHKKT